MGKVKLLAAVVSHEEGLGEGVCDVNSLSHGADCMVCRVLTAKTELPNLFGWTPSDQ